MRRRSASPPRPPTSSGARPPWPTTRACAPPSTGTSPRCPSHNGWIPTCTTRQPQQTTTPGSGTTTPSTASPTASPTTTTPASPPSSPTATPNTCLSLSAGEPLRDTHTAAGARGRGPVLLAVASLTAGHQDDGVAVLALDVVALCVKVGGRADQLPVDHRGRRPAAIQVDRVHRTQRLHHLGVRLDRQALTVGVLPSVNLHEQQPTLPVHADATARVVPNEPAVPEGRAERRGRQVERRILVDQTVGERIDGDAPVADQSWAAVDNGVRPSELDPVSPVVGNGRVQVHAAADRGVCGQPGRVCPDRLDKAVAGRDVGAGPRTKGAHRAALVYQRLDTRACGRGGAVLGGQHDQFVGIGAGKVVYRPSGSGSGLTGPTGMLTPIVQYSWALSL